MEPSLGQQLKLARSQRGLSLADAAHATRVPQARLQYLEEDNLAAFGNMAYARSFARIYSEYLGVDVDRWVKSLPQPVFAGAHDYRYLTNSFGPWVEPLRKRVRMSIHRPIAGERRRWHALMLFIIVAIGTLMLGNQFLTAVKGSRTTSEQPRTESPLPQRSAVVLPFAPVPAGQPKLVSFASKAGKLEVQLPLAAPLPPQLFDQRRQELSEPAAKP